MKDKRTFKKQMKKLTKNQIIENFKNYWVDLICFQVWKMYRKLINI